MHFHCPHCLNAINIVPSESKDVLTCPSCGSVLEMLDPDAETIISGPIKQIEQYRLLQKLGRGQFGEVWAVHDEILDRQVALKLSRQPHPPAQERTVFLREAQAAAQLHHPNIVAVHALGEYENRPYIISDLVRGSNLRDWLIVKRPTFQQTAKLVAEIADGLHHAHEAGVVHRDVKPGNILVNEQGTPLVADFGLAKRDTAVTVTLRGEILGTPAYMSPEQARGDAWSADRRTDIYSLGVVLYEMLAGVRPYDTKSRLLLTQILEDEPAPPRWKNRQIPRDLQTICLKAMAKQPQARYQTAGELAEDLRRYLAGQPILARPISRVEHIRRWVARHPSTAIAAAVIVALTLTLGVVAADNIRQRTPHVPTRPIFFDTEPSGANVVFVPIDPITLEPDASKALHGFKSPVTADIPPGKYWIEAEIPRFGFNGAERYVPATADEVSRIHRFEFWETLPDGRLRFKPLHIPNDAEIMRGMTYFSGGEFQCGDDTHIDIPRHTRSVEPFYLSQKETTVEEFLTILPDFDDRRQGRKPQETMVNVSQHDAKAYAELKGLRLMSEFEYEYAATLGGTRNRPWDGEPVVLTEWPTFTAAVYDKLPTVPPVYGLLSGAAEWTNSAHLPYPGIEFTPYEGDGRQYRVIRGAPRSVQQGTPIQMEVNEFTPAMRRSEVPAKYFPGVGFRTAKDAKPRYVQNGR